MRRGEPFLSGGVVEQRVLEEDRRDDVERDREDGLPVDERDGRQTVTESPAGLRATPCNMQQLYSTRILLSHSYP